MRATGAQIKYFYLESGWLQVAEYFGYSADDLVKKKNNFGYNPYRL